MSISSMVSFWASSPLSFAFSVTQCIALSLFVFCGKKNISDTATECSMQNLLVYFSVDNKHVAQHFNWIKLNS